MVVVLLVVAVGADSDPPIWWRKFLSNPIATTRHCTSNTTGLPSMRGHGADGR